MNNDIIYKKDAIETVLTYFIPRSHTGERGEHEEDFVRTIFKSLPSAEAVKGKWIRVGHDIYECSRCHQNVMTKDIDCYSYCHGCGASMQNERRNDG